MPTSHAIRFDLTSKQAAKLLADLQSNERFRAKVAANPVAALGARGIALPPDLAPGAFFVPDPKYATLTPPCEPLPIPPDGMLFSNCLVAAVLSFLRHAAQAQRPSGPPA